jgi:hypothetical protein
MYEKLPVYVLFEDFYQTHYLSVNHEVLAAGVVDLVKKSNLIRGK